MSRPTSTSEYQALAQFRFLIRRFLNHTDKAAQSVGLEPQQYTVLLALRGLPAGQEPSIRNLAERLQIQHQSAVELVNRMQNRGLIRRERSTRDRRSVLLYVTARGERLLSRLVRHRIAELRVSAPALAHTLQSAIAAASRSKRKSSSKKPRSWWEVIADSERELQQTERMAAELRAAISIFKHNLSNGMPLPRHSRHPAMMP